MLNILDYLKKEDQPQAKELLRHIPLAPTQKEAEEYYHHAIIENADWGAVDGMLSIKDITPETVGAEEYRKKREYFASRAIGGYPYVGTPDLIAEEMAALSRAGIRGIAFTHFVSEDIVRHPLVQRIVDAYDRAKT